MRIFLKMEKTQGHPDPTLRLSWGRFEMGCTINSFKWGASSLTAVHHRPEPLVYGDYHNNAGFARHQHQ